MSSLLQFDGRVGRRGIELRFVLVDENRNALGEFHCDRCGKLHERIYTAWRKPTGTWGPWSVFRYLGEEHVPDLSIPIGVPEAPRGAVRLSDKECCAIWRS